MKRKRNANPRTDKYGSELWFNDDGDYHREDGPAIKTPFNNQWYLNGDRHRTDGPAIEFLRRNPKLNNLYYFKGESLPKEKWFDLLTPEQKYNALWNM